MPRSVHSHDTPEHCLLSSAEAKGYLPYLPSRSELINTNNNGHKLRVQETEIHGDANKGDNNEKSRKKSLQQAAESGTVVPAVVVAPLMAERSTPFVVGVAVVVVARARLWHAVGARAGGAGVWV